MNYRGTMHVISGYRAFMFRIYLGLAQPFNPSNKAKKAEFDALTLVPMDGASTMRQS